jgi:S-adenosylhomocysteine hydrolase
VCVLRIEGNRINVGKGLSRSDNSSGTQSVIAGIDGIKGVPVDIQGFEVVPPHHTDHIGFYAPALIAGGIL